MRRSSSRASKLFSLGEDISAELRVENQARGSSLTKLFTLTCAPRMSEGGKVVQWRRGLGRDSDLSYLNPKIECGA